MQLKRISRLRNHRIFRDFAWPASLRTFGRLNVIYGWNGSGKSTLSNIFRSAEMRSPIADGEVTLDFDGVSVLGSALATSALPNIKVFNRAFVDDTVFSPGGAKPIFYIGKESKEKQEEVEKLRGQLNDPGGLLESAQAATSSVRAADRELDSHCSTVAARIKDTLRSSGASNPYNNYNKTSFRGAAESMLAGGLEAAKGLCLSEALKDEHVTKKNAARKEAVKLQMPTFPDLDVIRSSLRELLSRTVVAAALPSLNTNPALERWVKEGLPLHGIPRVTDVPAVGTCKFCENPLSNTRIAELEGHFNHEYDRLGRDIQTAKTEIQRELQSMSLVALPKPVEINDHLQAKFREYSEDLAQEAARMCGVLNAFALALESKAAQPFKGVSLESFLADTTQPDLAKAAESGRAVATIVETHNRECTDFAAIVEESRKALAQSAIAESLPEFSAKITAVSGAKLNERTLSDQIDLLRSEIGELEREIVEHRQAADELNSELVRYLGRDELKFGLRGTGYSITRSGQPATHLSEGEKTAIAFLYFLKTLNDKSFDLKNDIVVIDDPVSSLDANSLFCAFGYMKERTRGACQLFILTHSFPFFCQIRNWFIWENKMNKAQKPAQFYMLDCSQTPHGRSSAILPLDNLLQEFESEYHYLFKKVRDCALTAGTAAVALETYYGLPNIARRLLESFLSFRFPDDGNLYQRLNRLACEPAVRARVLRFVHTYSHEGAIGEEHDPTLLAETPSVLADILKLIESADGLHFKGMVDAITPK